MDYYLNIKPLPDSEAHDEGYRVTPENSPLVMPQESRPREKLSLYGPEAMSDHELLAILLNTGVQGKNVNALAADLTEMLDNVKGIPSIEELCQLTGMGISKASAIVAMLEFGKRRWGASGTHIRQPEDIFNTVRHFADRRQERFICLSLNGAHELLKVRTVTLGLVNRTIVHPREVFADPLLDRASAVAVAHNHPSGQLKPSSEDDAVTVQLVQSANILGLRFLDHVIFTDTGFYSNRKAGRLDED
jgi:DNA repair protein RadC